MGSLQRMAQPRPRERVLARRASDRARSPSAYRFAAASHGAPSAWAGGIHSGATVPALRDAPSAAPARAATSPGAGRTAALPSTMTAVGRERPREERRLLARGQGDGERAADRQRLAPGPGALARPEELVQAGPRDAAGEPHRAAVGHRRRRSRRRRPRPGGAGGGPTGSSARAKRHSSRPAPPERRSARPCAGSGAPSSGKPRDAGLPCFIGGPAGTRREGAPVDDDGLSPARRRRRAQHVRADPRQRRQRHDDRHAPSPSTPPAACSPDRRARWCPRAARAPDPQAEQPRGRPPSELAPASGAASPAGPRGAGSTAREEA